MNRQRLAALGLLVVLGLGTAAWWIGGPSRATDPRIPAAAMETWMVDALPGIGPRTRDGWHDRLRRQGPGHLPPAARDLARILFRWPPTGDGTDAAPRRRP